MSDITRTSDDLRERYVAVVMQQGRVIVDRDLNALQGIVEGQIAAGDLDEIGPCGTPDDGYAITTLPVPEAAQRGEIPIPFDFQIGPGTMYVGGRRVTLEPPARHAPPWSYFHQPDWLEPDEVFVFSASGPTSSTILNESVYLKIYEQNVGAIEDPDLLDVALGGPDTSARVRLMQRFVRTPVIGSDCPSALAELEAGWLQDGFRFHPKTMRLEPEARLQVGFTSTPSSGNPCDPVATGGYLGADNQLIRVQITLPDGSGQPQFLWGFDNASVLYRVSVQPDLRTLVLGQVPVDSYHIPQQYQVVEVLRTASVLAVDPDETDPNLASTLIRCVAEPTGLVESVKLFDTGNNAVVLNGTLPKELLGEKNPIFLRIWQGVQSITPGSNRPIVLTDPTGQKTPGVEVTITTPSTAASGASLPVGAYWSFAVRPATPQGAYPERFLKSPQHPDGPKAWACPLAVILWPGGQDFSEASTPAPVVINCRPCFENLVTLTNRRAGGCCTIEVRPSDAPRLQMLIDRAATGHPARVCFEPGTYLLTAPIRLGRHHAGLTLESCPAGARLQKDPKADASLFLDGLIVLVEAVDVSLRKLEMDLPHAPLTAAVAELGKSDPLFVRFVHRFPRSQSLIGVRLVESAGAKIEDCSFVYKTKSTQVVAAGILASGDCSGLKVRGCRFVSTATPSAAQVRQDPVETRRAAASILDRWSGKLKAVTPAMPAPETVKTPDDPAAGKLLPASPAAKATGVKGASPASPSAATPAIARPEPFAQLIQTSGDVEFIILSGVLATSSFGFGAFSIRAKPEGTLIRAVLDGGEIVANEFVNLSFAVACWADFGVFTVRKNRASACVTGIWLTSSDYAEPPLDEDNDADANFENGWNLVSDGLDHLIVLSFLPGFAEYLPLPRTVHAATVRGWGRKKASSGPQRLEILGNVISTLQAASTSLGGAALLLYLSRSQDQDGDVYSSLVVSSNDLRAGSTTQDDSVTIVGVAVFNGPTTITGNLFVNNARKLGSQSSLSLVLFPYDGYEFVEVLAVTGNVLDGVSNIDQVVRSDTRDVWTTFNWTYQNVE